MTPAAPTPTTALRADAAVIDTPAGPVQRPALVEITGSRITAIRDRDAATDAAEVITLARGEVLLPGLVDTHVHINEPGRTEWEGFATATRAAAAGGVTTLLDMPLNSIPPTTTVPALSEKRDRADGRIFVDVGFWGGAIPGNLDDLAALHDAGVFGFKCFLLDSGVPEFPPLDPSGFAAAAAELARLGALLIVHAEDADTIAHAPGAAGPHYADFLRSRPPAAEQRGIDQVIAAAHEYRGRLHVLHLSAAAALGALHAARADGLDLSVETCPHYLTLQASSIPDGATEFKCCPPIRDAGNQDALWAGLAAGDIDFVVSDHSPCTADLKRRGNGDFGQAWGGIASVQLGLPAVWTAARTRGHPLAKVVGWMAKAPADRVGLTGKGRIAVGADADLCVFDPDGTFTVEADRLLQRNPITAYAGQTLTGVVRATWLAGVPVDLAGPPRGRLLHHRLDGSRGNG